MTSSIIITTRDRVQELHRTLSRLYQLRPLANEILVCADGCVDETSVMLRKEFPQCILFENATPQGSVFSRDRLLREAKSEIIVSFDDDSYPVDDDFFARLEKLFQEHENVAVFSFPELRDGGAWGGAKKTPKSRPHLLSAYANCAAAMRRSVYLSSAGFPSLFEHMYEEPDYALQCYALGYVVRFEPGLTVRHHVSPLQRDVIRRHHRNARNELWSVVMRCPFPQAAVVALFRVWRQFRYACSEGFSWAVREPLWWWSAIIGIRECFKNRNPIPWAVYYRWMKLARNPIFDLDEVCLSPARS